MSQKYKVTCLNCDGTSDIEVVHEGNLKLLVPSVVKWLRVGEIISVRKRLDDKYGFECTCGANDIMTEQERRVIKDTQNPPQAREINEVVSNLKDEPIIFNMEAV